MLITGEVMNYICMGYLNSSSQEGICDQTNGAKKKYMVGAAVREPFRILTTTLLSLIYPLSLLLLARLSTAHYLFFSVVSNNYSSSSKPASFLCSLFLHTKPIFLHLLVSLISVSCLTHTLTDKIIVFISESRNPVMRPRLYAAWIFICVFQVCVVLGIEGSIAAGINGSGFISQEKGFFCRLVFFLGLHETMLFWGRMVVKPVVEDTIFGFPKATDQQGWAEKAVMGLAYGGLWWWRLREEVEALVVVPEVKRELKMGIGVADFVGWWLYYLTATIGIVKVVKGLIGTVFELARKRVEEKNRPNDEKV